jgi:glycosyltransferase involved in cell wall biosynthesis
MRILFGSYQAISILEGGVKIQVLSLKNALEKLGHQVSLFQDWGKISLKDYDWIHLFAAHLGTYHLARSLSVLGARIALAPIFYSRRSPKFIRFFLPFTKLAARFGGFYHYYVIADLCQKAALITPNTKSEGQLIHKAFKIPKSKIKLVPNGVDARFYDADPALFINKYGLKDFVLYVGHIGWQRKNLLTFLKVIKNIDVPLVIIGKILKNQYSNKCLEILKNRPHTLLINDLDHDSPMLQSAYRACDTFVLPSYYETPGLAALEAGLASAKIVITKYGGTREYFQDYAYYLNPYSQKSIKNSLEKALSAKKNPALKEHIKNNYLWEKIAKILVDVYKNS